MQHEIIVELCNKGEIDLVVNKNLETDVVENGYLSLADFLEKLIETNLVFIQHEKLRLLTEKCQSGILEDGRFFAADNKTGRLTNWLMKEKAISKEIKNR